VQTTNRLSRLVPLWSVPPFLSICRDEPARDPAREIT
jgi:hypothetical protein